MDKNSKIAIAVLSTALVVNSLVTRQTWKRLVQVRDTFIELGDTIEQGVIDEKFNAMIEDLDM